MSSHNEVELITQRAGKVSSSDMTLLSQESVESSDEKSLKGTSSTTKMFSNVLALVMLFITIYSFPLHHPSHGGGGKDTRYAWWCGWLTAVATGFGALLFYSIGYVPWINTGWHLQPSSSGLMITATGCLFHKPWYLPQATDYAVSVTYRLILGTFLGVLFIKFTKVFLKDYRDVLVCRLKGLDARKALLIMAVMTLHSVSKGIGVVVSLGGEGGIRRGHIVTMTMAFHNIPEGVAISLSLVPRGLQ